MVSELIDNLVKFSNINFVLLKDSMFTITTLISHFELLNESCEHKILDIVFKYISHDKDESDCIHVVTIMNI